MTHRHNNNDNTIKSEKVTKLDVEQDKEVLVEFGGTIGVAAMMLIFPLLMYYLWFAVDLHDGRLYWPGGIFNDIITHALPNVYATTVYVLFCLLQAVLAVVMPGPIVKGLPLPSENGAQLLYYCNGVWSLYSTLALSVVLHVSGIFPLTGIVENFAPLMTVSILAGFAVTFFTYFATVLFGKPHRMSGNLLYDIFMGAPLNPRIGKLDLKIWAEIRIPWVILFYVSLSAAIKQWEDKELSPELIFMCVAHLLYVNACMKGEECIPTTWDIFYEKWGFMLIFWNLAGVPFTYCIASLYLLKVGPRNYSLAWNAMCFILLFAGYYIWDTANSQKNRFRMKQRGTYTPRLTFPQLPWGTLDNPKVIKTKHGDPLLVDGWWQYARKIHYTGDLMMALSWGLITGFGSFLPYFYFTFMCIVLVHRTSRDTERCSKKYGEDWVAYCKRVPYTLIPGIY